MHVIQGIRRVSQLPILLRRNNRMSSSWTLHYEYVPNIMEVRDPYRPAHIDLIKSLVADGKMIVAGPYADASGALFIFRGGEGMNKDVIEQEFVNKDSYVANGLVTKWKALEWNSVLGSMDGKKD
jgi:uncharacterized protein